MLSNQGSIQRNGKWKMENGKWKTEKENGKSFQNRKIHCKKRKMKTENFVKNRKIFHFLFPFSDFFRTRSRLSPKKSENGKFDRKFCVPKNFWNRLEML